ncbi:MAG: exopolysaccharide Pel transporter PelG, partial [candidate division KSB1 bacterium]|nr:exopolysaccharide Pel transporter PelG [candidate division KSB1 bacterium]
MAGIGFELQKLVKRGSYLSYFQAFLVGTVLSSGPWLTTTASLLVLGLYTTFALQASTARLIVATIIYGYAFSLILTGPWQNVLTRHVADKVFEKRPTEILPGLRTAGVIIFALSLVVAAPAAAFARISAPVDNPVLFRVAAIALFVVLSELWLLMSYVSTSKTYGHVALSFLSGCAVSLALALLAARYGSASLALLGYGAGQLLIAASLAWQGQREYPGKGWWQTEYFAKIARYLPVALAGLFYNAGIWADKVILWITMGTPQGASLLRTYAPYDVPTFLAFLS